MRLFRPAAFSIALILTACAPVQDAWLTGWTSKAADDRIMLVRKDPPSFGHKRLEYQAALYPDLAFFLSKRGSPDFLAEMSNENRHYLILYYLAQREAYACRTKGARTHEVEFAGPYPITPREYKLLDGFRRHSARVNATR